VAGLELPNPNPSCMTATLTIRKSYVALLLVTLKVTFAVETPLISIPWQLQCVLSVTPLACSFSFSLLKTLKDFSRTQEAVTHTVHVEMSRTQCKMEVVVNTDD